MVGPHPFATHLDSAEPIQAVLSEILTSWPDHQIRVDADGISVTPLANQLPTQGWKMHVSATVLNATEVLRRVVPELLAADVAFKTVQTLHHLHRLGGGSGSARSQIGKFITIYPRDDTQAVDLAQVLDAATTGLDGPAIPSDRPLRPGSLVHYRFGAFCPSNAITPTGVMTSMVVDPDGQLVEDTLNPWFDAPTWAVDPFEEAGLTVRAQPQRGPIGSRYRIHRALCQCAKGGVYLADDCSVDPPRPVVIKEGRRAVMVNASGRDACDRIDHEHTVLRRLSPSPHLPTVYDHFVQEGNHFVVVEFLDGEPLSAWLEPRRLRGEHLAVTEIWALARRLFAILRWAHEAGVVLRDFAPKNIMRDPDGRLRLINVDTSHVHDDPFPANAGCDPAFTRFSACQADSLPVPDDDYFSLGAMLFYIATLTPPLVADGTDTLQLRLAEQLDLVCPDLPMPLRTIILALLATDVGASVDLATLSRLVDDPPTGLLIRNVRPRRFRERSQCASDLRTLAISIGDWILETARPDHPAACWPVSLAAPNELPITIQSGASGTGLFLLDLFRVTNEPRFLDGADMAVEWSLGWIERNPQLTTIPGLYFGLGGPAWLALQLARYRNSSRDQERAVQLMDRIDQLDCAYQDLCHGLAGVGWMHLLAAQTLGAPAHVERVRAIAATLTAQAVSFHGGLGWKIRSGSKPDIYYGYSHGVAGIGTFLLEAAALTGDPASAAAAQGAAAALLNTPVPVRNGTGWSWYDSHDSATVRPHFCHGAAGVGLFLTRLYAMTGAKQARVAADRAAEATFHGCKGTVVGLCHGIAGGGLFLLDLHHATGSDRYRNQAFELAHLLVLRAHEHNGHRLWKADWTAQFTADLMRGNAGVGAFLLRLAAPRQLEHPVSLPLPRSAPIPAAGNPSRSSGEDVRRGTERRQRYDKHHTN